MTDLDRHADLDPQARHDDQARVDPEARPQVPAPPAAEAAGARAGAPGPRQRPRALPTVLASLACFAVAFEFLAFQLSSGHDPALGAAAMAGSAQTAKSRPVRKKIVITRVVPSAGTTTSSTGSSYSSPATAPAPAPAPVATSSS